MQPCNLSQSSNSSLCLSKTLNKSLMFSAPPEGSSGTFWVKKIQSIAPPPQGTRLPLRVLFKIKFGTSLYQAGHSPYWRSTPCWFCKAKHHQGFRALTKVPQGTFSGVTSKKPLTRLFELVPPAGLEPATVSLKGYCSTS